MFGQPLLRPFFVFAPLLFAKGLDVNLESENSAPAKVAKSWYNANAAPLFPVAAIPWSRYTQIAYSFAVPTEDPGVLALNMSQAGPDVLPDFVKAAHENGVKATISIGGWNGSVWYSNAVASTSNRTKFVNAITDLVTEYSLDGVDFDWEYPNRQGIGCNTISDHDTDNFLAMLQELRQHPVGSKLILSAAASVQPWNDVAGNPSTNLSGFATVLDHIAVMNYDIYGPWSDTVGPNSPLNDTCAPKDRQVSSAIAAIDAWNKVGIPKSKLVLGTAAYGHGFSVNKTDAYKKDSEELALYPPFNKNIHPKGDMFDDPEGLVDPCGVVNHAGGTFSFRGLIEEGYLNEDGTPKVSYLFDECSQTAYVYNDEDEVMVSFDDERAFAAKGKFIKDYGVAGFATWHTAGDYNDILTDAIRKSMGL